MLLMDGTGVPAIFEDDVQMCDDLVAHLGTVPGVVAGMGGQLRANCYTGAMSVEELLHRRLGHVSWGNKRLAGRLRKVLGAGVGTHHNCGACEACMPNIASAG